MKPEDLNFLRKIVPCLPAGWTCALQGATVEARSLIPWAHAFTEERWPASSRRADTWDLVITACQRAELANMRASGRFVLQLSEDGAPGESLPEGALGQSTYAGRSATLWLGERAAPLLRVDDYPTGVRPILDDLEPLHGVLRQIDDAGLPFHLGIVPAILTDEMSTFLRSLEHLVPLAHGFQHGYPEKSQLLLDSGDPQNQRGTVGGFDEFAGQSQGSIQFKLTRSREILEKATERCVTGYIPPCNEGNRATGRALVGSGYTHYLSEKRIPGCPLPWRSSDFYGLSSEYEDRDGLGVVCLHATWEVDRIEAGDTSCLPRMLEQLSARQTAAREEGLGLARAVFD